MSVQQNEDERIGADEPAVGAAKVGKGDYKVGRGRPPKDHSWKKGQSGNPSGRPRKKLDKKAIWERIMNEQICVREDGKTRKVTKYEAICQAHMAKAMKGDGRSAKFVIEEAARAGFDDELDIASALPPPKDTSRQSEALFDNLDLGRLSDVDKIELARLGQIIDLGGDFTALSARDFERAKQIADKGRGKEITLSG